MERDNYALGTTKHVWTRKRDKADEMPARQTKGMTPGPTRLDIPREIKIKNEIKGIVEREDLEKVIP